MRNDVRRQALTTVAAVAVLGLVAGCGSAADADAAKSGGEAKTDASAVEALSRAELEKLALKQGDVEGFDLANGSKDEIEAPPKGTKVKPAACEPYLDLARSTAPGDPAAVVVRNVTEKQEQQPVADGDGELSPEELEDFGEAMDKVFTATSVRVGVATYEGDGAVSALENLRSWAGACTGGFSVGPQKQGIADLKDSAAARGADEAVTFTVTAELEGKKTPMAKYAVYRDGNTVALFNTMNVAALAGDGNGSWDVPAPVVEAQLGKLG